MNSEDFGAIPSLLADLQHYHSDFQMDAFITARAGSGHPWGMYIQALHELSSRFSSYQRARGRIEEVKLEREEARLDACSWGITARQRIKKAKAALRVQELTRQLEADASHDLLRELERFHKQVLHLRDLHGFHGVTEVARAKLDEGMWLHKLRLQLAIDYMRNGKPSVALLETLPSLPKAMKQVLRADLADAGPLMAWYNDHEVPEALEDAGASNRLNGNAPNTSKAD